VIDTDGPSDSPRRDLRSALVITPRSSASHQRPSLWVWDRSATPWDGSCLRKPKLSGNAGLTCTATSRPRLRRPAYGQYLRLSASSLARNGGGSFDLADKAIARLSRLARSRHPQGSLRSAITRAQPQGEPPQHVRAEQYVDDQRSVHTRKFREFALRTFMTWARQGPAERRCSTT
jgi:hypothetical protein